MRDERDGAGEERAPGSWPPASSDAPGQPAAQPQTAQPQPAQPQPAQPQPGQPADQPQPGDSGQPDWTRPLPAQPDLTPPSFGHPGYAPPGHGQDQPGYGQPGYSQPGYGQPGYSQPGHTQPGYSQSGYGQPPYGGWPGYLPQPSGPRRRGRHLIAYLAVAALAAAAGALGTLSLRYSAGNATATPPPAGGPLAPSSGASPGAGSGTSSAVVNAVQPGVVDIASNLGYQGGQAAATGMVISSDGYVLTNNHVIIDTTGLYATVVSTGQRFSARWIGYDSADDVAVIKLVGAKNMRTIPIGDSGTVQVGDQVVALGNAEGRGVTVAVSGSVTGLNRTITASDGGAGTSETLTGMIQTNAAIVPGDSGGPLASMNGHVIGMNTAAATGDGNQGSTAPGTAQNVGFAIPINRALTIARQIIAGKASISIKIGATGFLGVLVPNIGAAKTSTNPKQQQQLQQSQDATQAQPGCLRVEQPGVPATIAPASSGALVLGVLCGTASAQAGLQPGDVITDVGSHVVNSPDQLSTTMLTYQPGAQVPVTWTDVNGQTHHATLTLGQRPPL